MQRGYFLVFCFVGSVLYAQSSTSTPGKARYSLDLKEYQDFISANTSDVSEPELQQVIKERSVDQVLIPIQNPPSSAEWTLVQNGQVFAYFENSRLHIHGFNHRDFSLINTYGLISSCLNSGATYEFSLTKRSAEDISMTCSKTDNIYYCTVFAIIVGAPQNSYPLGLYTFIKNAKTNDSNNC